MKKEIDYLEIEKYLLNELEGEKLLDFENRLKEDVAFAKEVSLYKEVHHTLSSRFSNYKEENDLRNTLEDLSTIHINKPIISQVKEELSKKEVPVFSLKKYRKYLVAASLVLFASILWMNSNKSVNYNDYNEHGTIELVVRGANNEHLSSAEKAFNTKNYALAEKEFTALLKEDSTKIELQLYLAICMVEQNKFALADNMLHKITQGNSVYKSKAIWNLALSKLKQKEYNSCKKVLQTLPKEAEDYTRAQKLLDNL